MTDLPDRIDAIIRRERIPDRAGTAIVEMLSEQYVLTPKNQARRAYGVETNIGWMCIWLTPDEVVQLIEQGKGVRRTRPGECERRSGPDLARDAPGGE